MPVNIYETLLIFDANRYARDPSGVPAQMVAAVEKRGGKIRASRLWEERRLAYPINGQRKGAYWLTYFELEAGQVTGLERDFQLSEDIMRALVLKVDPRIADALIAHAQTAAPTVGKPPEGPGGPPRGGRPPRREAVAEAAPDGSEAEADAE